jgi:hypothetical protein
MKVILYHSFRKFAASRPITPTGQGGLATKSHKKTSASCHCERSEAISWPIWGLLRRLRRLAMTKMAVRGWLLSFSNFLK